MARLIIDSNNIAHIAANAMPELTARNDPVHVIYGFLLSLFSIQKTYYPEDIVFVWDSKRSFRKLVYPKYKGNRRKDLTEDEKENLAVMFSQFTELRTKVLPELGFNNILMQPGFEGDDLIGHVVQNNPEDNWTIVSTDKDLYQLLTKNVLLVNPITKKGTSRGIFIKEYGINPEQWADVISIAGCSGDNVAGIERVGDKTAIKYIKGELPESHKTYKSIISEEGQAIIKRNLPLVKLPYSGPNKIKGELVEQVPLIKNNFRRVFERYDFDSFLSGVKFEQWIDAFDLKTTIEKDKN